LKKYMAVEKHFEDFHEDQFDFHSYCIRKVTLRAYIDVLRWEDHLWSQKCYGITAEGIINCYIHLFDNPKDALTGEEEPDYSKMTSAEKKKAKAAYRKKRKKAEQKAAEEANKKKVEAEAAMKENGDNKTQHKKPSKPVFIDPDPNGYTLLKRNPLDEAKKFVATLVKNAPFQLNTWILQYDVAIRRNKKLMALQALFKAKAIDSSNSDVFYRILDFALKNKVETPDDSTHLVVKDILENETKLLLSGRSIEEFTQEAYTSVKNNPLTGLSMRISVMKALLQTKTGTIADATSLILNGGMDGREVSVTQCRKVLTFLNTYGKDLDEARSIWIDKVKERFPLIKNFH